MWGIFKKDTISDAYLKMKAKKADTVNEETEQLDELSIGALKSYIKGAKASKKFETDVHSTAARKNDWVMASDAHQTLNKRKEGIKAAKAKLNKEETETEAELSEKIIVDKDGNKIGGGTVFDKLKDKPINFKPKTDDKEEKSEVKEEAEDLVEYESKDGVYKHQAKPGRYGGSEQESDYVKGPSDAELKKIEAKKKTKAKMEELEIFSEKELDMLVNEVLSKDQSAGKWISDFVKSDDPKFAGDSKKQRIQRALGAYYNAQRNESTDYESFVVLDEEKQADVVKMGAKEIKHANMKDKQNDQEVMEPHSGTEAKFIDAHSVRVTDDPTRDKLDAGKVPSASEPTGKGAGSYDAKEKLGDQGIKSTKSVQEAIVKTEAGEEIDTTPGEKKDNTKKASSVKGQKVAGDDNDHS